MNELTTTNNQLTTTNNLYPIIALVTDGLTSEHSKRAYERSLASFLEWYDGNGFNKAAVNTYRAHLIHQGKSTSAINQALSAIRKLASEASDNGLLDPTIAAGIGRVKGVSQKGTRSGNWLTKEQAQRLINTPDTDTLKGIRDRAILAVMIGTGLRRQETAGLMFAHIQQRQGRWVIIDLVGKGNRIRTIPMPAWAKSAVDQWAKVASLHVSYIFRSIGKSGHIGETITAQAIYNIVIEHAETAGLTVVAHDLRRTFAKLAHSGGAELEQIQLTLGHASIQTTERYLGVQQNLDRAPCDVLGLSL